MPRLGAVVGRRYPRWEMIVLEQDAVGGAIEIIELSGLQGPQKGAEPEQAQEQRRRYEIQ